MTRSKPPWIKLFINVYMCCALLWAPGCLAMACTRNPWWQQAIATVCFVSFGLAMCYGVVAGWLYLITGDASYLPQAGHGLDPEEEARRLRVGYYSSTHHHRNDGDGYGN